MAKKSRQKTVHSAVFHIPTRHDVEAAKKRAAAEGHHRVRIRYVSKRDDSTEEDESTESDDSEEEEEDEEDESEIDDDEESDFSDDNDDDEEEEEEEEEEEGESESYSDEDEYSEDVEEFEPEPLKKKKHSPKKSATRPPKLSPDRSPKRAPRKSIPQKTSSPVKKVVEKQPSRRSTDVAHKRTPSTPKKQSTRPPVYKTPSPVKSKAKAKSTCSSERKPKKEPEKEKVKSRKLEREKPPSIRQLLRGRSAKSKSTSSRRGGAGAPYGVSSLPPSSSFPVSRPMPMSVSQSSQISAAVSARSEPPVGYAAAPFFEAHPLYAHPQQQQYFHQPQAPFVNYSAAQAPSQYPGYAPPNGHSSGAFPQSFVYPMTNAPATFNPSFSNVQGPQPNTTFPPTDVQTTQHEIDQIVSALSRAPHNTALKAELSTLQAKLNVTLNALLAGPKASKETQTSIKEQDVTPENGYEESNIEPRRSTGGAQIGVAGDRTEREASPESDMRHHICSTCSRVRSERFHARHPILPGHKPILNICKSCQEAEPDAAVLQIFHFCFRCGIVRSKAYQLENPRKREDPLIPNYCGKCIREIKSVFDVAEASVIDHDDRRDKGENSTLGHQKRNSEGRWRRGHRHDQRPEHHGGSKTLRSKSEAQHDYQTHMKSVEGLPPSSTTLAADPMKRHQEKKHSRASRTEPKKPLLQPIKSSRVPPLHSPVVSSQDNSFYPNRIAGSSQRRAQRSPLTRSGGILAASSDTEADIGGYRAPYVEDSTSPLPGQSGDSNQPSSAGSPLHLSNERAHERHSPVRVGESGEPSTDTTENHVDESSRDSELYPHSLESIDEVLPSGWTQDGEPTHSSENKTVKFGETVEISRPEPLTSSDEWKAAEGMDRISPRIANTGKQTSAFAKQTWEEQWGFPKTNQEDHEWEKAESPQKGRFTGAWSRFHPPSIEREQTPPTKPHINSPPLWARMPGFSPTIDGKFDTDEMEGKGNKESQEGEEDVEPTFRSSRGAFGSAAFKQPRFSPTSYSYQDQGSSRRSSSGHHAPDDENLRGRARSPWESTFRYDGVRAGGASAFRTNQGFFKEDSNDDNDDERRGRAHEDEKRHGAGFSEFSRVNSGNPYYAPRRPSFREAYDEPGFWDDQDHPGDPRWDDDANGGRMKGRGWNNGSAGEESSGRDWDPEPIIEEPSSPVCSEAPPAMLIEFNESDNETASPFRSDEIDAAFASRPASHGDGELGLLDEFSEHGSSGGDDDDGWR